MSAAQSGFSRLKQMGQKLLKKEEKKNFKAEPLPADVSMDRRSGRRVPLPLDVRVKLSDEDDPREARLRDVNLTGLAVEPAWNVAIRDRVSVGFDGYPDVCPSFAIVGKVRRILPAENPGDDSAMGLEIDRERSSAESLLNYRRLIRHYLQHRSLVSQHTGYSVGRCSGCEWKGRVGKRNPACPKCGSSVVVENE